MKKNSPGGNRAQDLPIVRLQLNHYANWTYRKHRKRLNSLIYNMSVTLNLEEY